MAHFAFDELISEDFHDPLNRQVFNLFQNKFNEGESLDVTSIEEYLTEAFEWPIAKARDYTMLSIGEVQDSTSLQSHVKILKKYTSERHLLQIATMSLDKAPASEIQGILDKASNVKTAVSVGMREVSEQLNDEITGKRASVDFPDWPLLSETEALMPGGMLIVCGSPGVSKSFFTIEPIWNLAIYHNVKTAMLCLESGAIYHSRRALAQIAGCSNLTKSRWVRENPESVEQITNEYGEVIERLRNVVYAPTQKPTCAVLLDWMRRQSDQGCRVLAIDPISIMAGGAQRFIDQENFMDGAEKICQKYQNALICVTHPRDSAQSAGFDISPCLQNLPGSRHIERRFTNITWLEYIKPEQGMFSSNNPQDPSGTEARWYNRILWNLKIRNSKPMDKIAYWFNPDTLRHEERGILTEN